MWPQAHGAGAMNWDDEDIPDAPILSISDVALDPQSYEGEVIPTDWIFIRINRS